MYHYKKIQENLKIRVCAESHGLIADLYHSPPVITACNGKFRKSMESPFLENSTRYVACRKAMHTQRLVQSNLAYTSQSLGQPLKPSLLSGVSCHRQQSNVEHHRQMHSSRDSINDRGNSNAISLVESKHLARERECYLWNSDTVIGIGSNQSFGEIKRETSKKQKKYFHEENLPLVKLNSQEADGDSHLRFSESHYDSLIFGSPDRPVTLGDLENVSQPSLKGRSNTLRSILKSSQTSASLHHSMLSLGDNNHKAKCASSKAVSIGPLRFLTHSPCNYANLSSGDERAQWSGKAYPDVRKHQYVQTNQDCDSSLVRNNHKFSYPVWDAYPQCSSTKCRVCSAGLTCVCSRCENADNCMTCTEAEVSLDDYHSPSQFTSPGRKTWSLTDSLTLPDKDMKDLNHSYCAECQRSADLLRNFPIKSKNMSHRVSDMKIDQRVPVDGEQSGTEDPFQNTVEHRKALSVKYSDHHLHSSVKFQSKSSYPVCIANIYTKQHRAPDDLWIQESAHCVVCPGLCQTRNESNSSHGNLCSEAQEEEKSVLRSTGVGSRTLRIKPVKSYSRKSTSQKGEKPNKREIFHVKSEDCSHSHLWKHGPMLMEAFVSNVSTKQFLQTSSLRDCQQLQSREPRGFPLDGRTKQPVERYLTLYHQRLLSQCLCAWHCFVQQRYTVAISLQEHQLLRKGLHALHWAVQLTQIQEEFLERRQCTRLLAHFFKRWRDAGSPSQCQLVAGAPKTVGKSCAIHLRKSVTLQPSGTKIFRPWRSQQEPGQSLSLASLQGQCLVCTIYEQLSARLKTLVFQKWMQRTKSKRMERKARETWSQECVRKVAMHWLQAVRSQRLGELPLSTPNKRDRRILAATLEVHTQKQAACTKDVWLLVGKRRLWAKLNARHLYNKGTLVICALLTGANCRQLQLGCFDAWARFTEQKTTCQHVLERSHIDNLRSFFLQWCTMLQLKREEKVTVLHLFQLCHTKTRRQTTALGDWNHGENDDFIQDGVSETCVQVEDAQVSRQEPYLLDSIHPDQTLQPAFQDWRKEAYRVQLASEFCRILTWSRLEDALKPSPEEFFQLHLQGFSKHLPQQDCKVTSSGTEESSDTNCSSPEQGIMLQLVRLHEARPMNRPHLERAGKWLQHKVEKHLVEQHLVLWAARLQQVCQVEQFHQQSLLARAFLRWSLWRQACWRCRELVARFSFVRQCRVVLTFWKIRLLQKLEADRRCRAMSRQQIQKAMSQWRTHTRKRRQLHNLQAHFLSVQAQSVKLLIFSTWQQKAERQRNMKIMADGMVQQRYLRAWHLATLQTEERRQNLRAFQTGQTRRTLWRSFSWWKYRCELRRFSEYHRLLRTAQRAAHCWRQRMLLSRAVRHRHTVLTQILFRRWKEAVRLSQLSFHFAGNNEERRLRLLFNSWANLVKERKDNDTRLQMKIFAVQHRVVQAAFHQVVTLYRKSKEADRFYHLTLLRRSLLSWVEFVHQQKQWMLTVSVQVSVLLLSSLFVTWRNQLSLHSRLILLVQRQTERILQKALRSWYREMQAIRHRSKYVSRKFVSRWVLIVLARKQANLWNGMEYQAEEHCRNRLCKRFLIIWWHKTLLQQFLEKKRVEEIQEIWKQWKDFTISMLVTRGLCQQRLEGKAWQMWRRRFVQTQVSRVFAAQDDRILMSNVFTAWFSLAVVKPGDPQLQQGNE
ncbi:uncharacterized protein [Heterodontus francisci]|uniref:uncharacterized protein n=1 Tax=Heterodontus francisci TaxID=7792 RepID=UPI00355C0114